MKILNYHIDSRLSIFRYSILFFLFINQLFFVKVSISESSIKDNTQTEEKGTLSVFSFLSNYKASYEVYYDNDLVGTTDETLTSNNGEWKLQINAKVKKLFFKVKSKEFSEFQIQQGKLIAQRFYSKTEMTFKKDKIIEQVFDWKNNVETGTYKGKSWRIPIEKQLFDRMSHTIQLRKDLYHGDKENTIASFPLKYLISQKGKTEIYLYEFVGEEELLTTFGKYRAIELQRTKPNGDKFSIWFSPKLDYFPIKISQKEKDKTEVFFLLKNLSKTE